MCRTICISVGKQDGKIRVLVTSIGGKRFKLRPKERTRNSFCTNTSETQRICPLFAPLLLALFLPARADKESRLRRRLEMKSRRCSNTHDARYSTARIFLRFPLLSRAGGSSRFTAQQTTFAIGT